MATTTANQVELTFPAGLVGCPEWRHFRLEERVDIAPVMLLHVQEQPGLSLVVADPKLWFPAYTAEPTLAERETLGAGPKDALITLTILTIESEPFRVTANLLGPLLLNPSTGRGCQAVQSNRPYLAAQPIGLETRVLVFADGWVGCPEWRTFVLHESPQTYPVRLLVSRDQPRLSLPVIQPWLINPNYAPRLAESDREALGLAPNQQPEWLCTLDVTSDPAQATANLLGPLVFNPRTGAARQVILTNSAYSARQPVGDALAARTDEWHMLVLTRRPDEAIVIGEGVVVTILAVEGDRVKLGIKAPLHVTVLRQELCEAVREQNLAAAANNTVNSEVLQNLRRLLSPGGQGENQTPRSPDLGK